VKQKIKKRNIVHEFEFAQDLARYLRDEPRRDQIVKEWSERVSQNPDFGYAVPGAPDYLGLPLHAERSSYLVIYWYDDDHVYCIGMRRIPRSVYGEFNDER
jgi:hypothetical protein